MLENIALVNITDIIEQKITDEIQLKAIKNISRQVKEGIPVRDACLIARIKPEIYDKWVKNVPEIGELMEIGRLEYKQSLQRVLYQQATQNGDFKIALQLLMTGFPQEFNPAIQKETEKGKLPQEDKDDVLRQVFDFVTKGEESSSVINTEQYKSETKRSNEDIDNTIKRILT